MHRPCGGERLVNRETERRLCGWDRDREGRAEEVGGRQIMGG